MNKHIFIFELGGTICSPSEKLNPEFYKSPCLSIEKIIDELHLRDGISVEIYRYSQKISHEFDTEEMINLCKKIQDTIHHKKCNGVVVAMGTNALEDIAYFTGLVVHTEKPIVFTGSHFPQNSMNFDGTMNLYNAVHLAASDKACRQGVLVTFNSYVVSARDATKICSGLTNNFTLENKGVIGYMVGQDFYMKYSPVNKHTYKSDFHLDSINTVRQVCIVYAHLGINSLSADSIIPADAEGVISAGFGKGYQSECVTQIMHKAILNNKVVVRCARVGASYSNVDLSYDSKYGFIMGNDLSPHKCALLLSLSLVKTKNRNEIQRIFNEY